MSSSRSLPGILAVVCLAAMPSISIPMSHGAHHGLTSVAPKSDNNGSWQLYGHTEKRRHSDVPGGGGFFSRLWSTLPIAGRDNDALLSETGIIASLRSAER
ncbi:hypothetical protein BV25DRAFT_1819463 [Artomyces pyxidatus]|uniref:Uncharacterized protein n=1 Tax=Artomyces pyxidatus TaxID=48021 RepID=A0ACB8TFF7_9AGAM|nr:hypothetical protein BV25DRAFT_1819463 [Artomyces pyxidatus]